MNDTVTSTEIIPNISYNQHDIIRWIIKLHLNGESIHLDPCYGNGNFYTPDDINAPLLISDIDPEKSLNPIDCRNTTLENNEIKSIIFDPPFLQTTGKGSVIKDRFGSYPTMELLCEFYYDSLVEFHRIIEAKGVLIVKMQNTVMSGKQWWSVDYINEIAKSIGYKKIDQFVLLAKHRIPQWNMKNQRHARKFESYFLVFRRQK